MEIPAFLCSHQSLPVAEDCIFGATWPSDLQRPRLGSRETLIMFHLCTPLLALPVVNLAESERFIGHRNAIKGHKRSLYTQKLCMWPTHAIRRRQVL